MNDFDRISRTQTNELSVVKRVKKGVSKKVGQAAVAAKMDMLNTSRQMDAMSVMNRLMNGY
jgi:hypothetical protein